MSNADARPRSVRANMAWYALPRLLSRGSSLLLLPIYTRVLSPAEMGAAVVVLAVGGVLSLVVAPGIDAAYFRWAYRPEPTPDRGDRAGTVAAAHAVLLGGSLGLLAGFGAPITRWLLPGIPVYPFYFVILATAGLSSIAVPRQTAWRAERRPEKLAVFEIAHAVIATTAILVGLLGVRAGAVSLVIGDLVALLVLLPWYGGWFARELGRGWERALAPDVARVALVGVPLALSAWVLSALDRLLLNRLAGPADVGIYSAAYQIGAAATFITIILNKEWQPVIFALAHQPAAEAAHGLRRFWSETVCVFLAFGSLLAIFSHIITDLVLGEAYLSAAAVVPIVVVVSVLRVPWALAIHLSRALDKTRDLVIDSVGTVIVFVAANAVLIPRWGARGAAAAGVVTFLASAGFMYSRAWNVFRVDWAVALWAAVLVASVMTGTMAGGTLAAHIAGFAVAVLALRQAVGYWQFLGGVSVREAAI